jgi:hypothetical protein
MKKYFLFDDEPITGENYLRRMMVGYLSILILVGIWICSSTAYKRAGAFGWKKELRIIVAILIPILTISAFLVKEAKGYDELPINLFDIIALLAFIFHLILASGNGNKIPEDTIENEFEIKDSNNFGFERIILKTKFFRNKLYFKIIGSSLGVFGGFKDKSPLPYHLIFKNKDGIEIFKLKLPKQIFAIKNNQTLKSGDWKFGSYFQINENLANQISDVEIKP